MTVNSLPLAIENKVFEAESSDPWNMRTMEKTDSKDKVENPIFAGDCRKLVVSERKSPKEEPTRFLVRHNECTLRR